MSLILNQPNLPAIVNRYYADMLQNLCDKNIYDQSVYAVGLKSPKMGPVLNSAVPAVTGGASLATGSHYYVVVAMFADEDSMASLEVKTVVSGANNSANLTWSAVVGAVGYKVYRTETSGFYVNSLIRVINNGATTTFTDTGYLLQDGTPVAFQLQITGQVTPAGSYQVAIFLSRQGNAAQQIDTINTDANGKFAFNFNPQGGTNEVYVYVSGQGRSPSVYVNAYNLHLFLEAIGQEMLNNWQSTIQRAWITPQLNPSKDLFSNLTIESSDADFQMAWGAFTSVVNDSSISGQYRALVQAMIASYKKATTFQALLDVFTLFQNSSNLNWIIFYNDGNTAFRLGKTYLAFSVVRSAPATPSLEFAWTGGLVNINNQKRYVQAGNETITGSPIPAAVFVYVDGTLNADGYLNVKFYAETVLDSDLVAHGLPNNVKVLAVILTNGTDDITDIAGNCALTSSAGPRGLGYGPFICGPTFISRRARLNGRQYKYSRFLMYMPDLISSAPAVVASVKNLLSDMKPAKMTILFGTGGGTFQEI